MPYPEPSGGGGFQLAARPESLRGATVGLVNNGWRCMNVIADEYRRRLVDDCGVREVLEERISAAQTLPDERFATLAARCHAVIVGIGN